MSKKSAKLIDARSLFLNHAKTKPEPFPLEGATPVFIRRPSVEERFNIQLAGGGNLDESGKVVPPTGKELVESYARCTVALAVDANGDRLFEPPDLVGLGAAEDGSPIDTLSKACFAAVFLGKTKKSEATADTDPNS